MASPLARIAILTPHASPDYVGGIETFNKQLAQALGDVDIFAAPVSSRYGAVFGVDRIGLKEPYRALQVARSFMERHRSQPYQLVMCNGLYGWPLSLGHMDIPMVQVYHYTPVGFARKAIAHRGDRLITGRVTAFFHRLAGRRKRIVAVSVSVLQEVKDYYRMHGEVIPNGVDTNLFRRVDQSEARQKIGLSEEATVGLFVGRSEYAKGFDILLKVAEALSDVTFVIAGGSAPLKPNVRPVGKIPRSQMPLLYSASDFLLLPSRYEGFNLSVLEALACNLPIVVSQAAYPFPDDPSRFGSVVANQSLDEYVRAIRAVIERGSPINSRREIVSRYSFDVFRDNWRRLTETMLEGSNLLGHG